MDLTLKVDDTLLIEALQSAFQSGSYGTSSWAAVGDFSSYEDLVNGKAKVELQEINEDESRFDGKIYTLDRPALERGLMKLSNRENLNLFCEFIQGKIDGPLGDVFVQLAVLGEIRYG